ncbi:MAG TPA: hypothetical protein VF283_15540, partial [Bryobacteraceae bacterium]
QQDRCARESRVILSELPEAFRHAVESMGTLLSFGDGFASCIWGCHGKEHVIENLVGRAVSNARAAFRLIEFGHYDEALSLIRNIAEIANIMWLFYNQPAHIRSWLDLPEAERNREYSAVKVRLKLESIGATIPCDRDEYRDLCRAAVHPDPQVRPQAHNQNAIPTTGGYFQERAYVDCVSKLASSLASAIGPAAKVALLSKEIAEHIVSTCVSLLHATPTFSTQLEEISGCSKRLLDLTLAVDKNVRMKE